METVNNDELEIQTGRNAFVRMLCRVFSSKWLIPAVVALGIFFLFPTYWGGFKTDDLIHRSFMNGSPELFEKGYVHAEPGVEPLYAITKFFTFFDPNIPGHIESQKQYGTVPWWIYEKVKLSFFRPVSAFTHWIDYQLWPDSPEMMHLQNLIWMALWLLMAGILYRRFIGAVPAAGLAATFFALDLSYALTVGWIANRNALIATTFGLLTIYLHDKWRKSGSVKFAVLTQLIFLITLLSAEAGIAVTAYIFAYAVCLEKGNWWQRLRTLIPTAAITVVWRLVYVWLGYGAANTGMYIDPGRDPLRFLGALIERGPILLFSQFFVIEDVTPMMSLEFKLLVWLVMVILLIVLGVLFYPLFRSNKVARFMLLGALVAVIPLPAYGLPQGRLLTFVSFGAMGFVSLFICNLSNSGLLKDIGKYWFFYLLLGPVRLVILVIKTLFKPKPWTELKNLKIFSTLTGILLLVLHLFVSFFAKLIFLFAVLTGQSSDMTSTSAGGAMLFKQLFYGVGVHEESEVKDILLVNSPNPFLLVYAPYYIAYLNEGIKDPKERVPLPEHFRIMAAGLSPIELERIADNVVKVRPKGGFLIPPRQKTPGDPKILPEAHQAHLLKMQTHGYRVPENNPLNLGDVIQLEGVRIEITEMTDDGRPAEATFTYEKSLDDPTFRWIYWNHQSLRVTGEKTIEMRPAAGFHFPEQSGTETIHPQALLDLQTQGVCVPDRNAFKTGDTFEMKGAVAEVTEITSYGCPGAVSFTFDKPISDPSMKWLEDYLKRQKNTTNLFSFESFAPPKIGETAVVAGPFY